MDRHKDTTEWKSTQNFVRLWRTIAIAWRFIAQDKLSCENKTNEQTNKTRKFVSLEA